MHQPPKPTLAPRRVLETFVKPEALPPRPRFLSSTVHGAFSLFAKEGPPQNRRFCGERRGKGVQRSRRRQAAAERNEFRPDEMGGCIAPAIAEQKAAPPVRASTICSLINNYSIL